MKFYPTTTLTVSAVALAEFIHSGNTPGILLAAVGIGGLAAFELLEFVQSIRKDRQEDADMMRVFSEDYLREGNPVPPTLIAEEQARYAASKPLPVPGRHTPRVR